MLNFNTNIKEWYISTYPTDEVGERLNTEVSNYIALSTKAAT